MKKLLTFAGVSALALVAATSDGFAFAQNKSGTLGTFKPQCTLYKPDFLQVKFWGLDQTGNVAALRLNQTIEYDFANNNWNVSPQTFINTIVGTAELASYTGDYKNGLRPRAVQFIGSGNFWSINKIKSYYDTNPNYIADGTITGMASKVIDTNLYNAAQIAAIEEMFAGLPTQAVDSTYKLPTFSQATKAAYADTLSGTLNFIVLYAAKCVEDGYSKCELRVADDGTAIYKNSCKEGCWADAFGVDEKQTWDSIGEFEVDFDSDKFTESTVEVQYENLFNKDQ